MVDSNDQERIKEAAEVLHEIINEEEMKDNPILVFANKQDLPHAMSVPQITEHLDLTKLSSSRNWHI